MPQIAKPKPNIVTKAAEKIKAASPLPDWLNNAILPTDPSIDVSGIPAGGAIEPAVQAGASMLGPLISIYKNKEAREAATEEFRASVLKFLSDNDKSIPETAADAWARAVDTFSGKYPRIAAHIRQNPTLEPYGAATASIATPPGQVTHPLTLNLHPRGVAEIAQRPEEAIEALTHEGTHAAQSLGNKNAYDLYNYAEAIGGYKGNPFEIAARNAELKSTGRPNDPIRIGGYLRFLADEGFAAPQDSLQRTAATRMTKILNRREAKPLAPTQEQLAAMNPLDRMKQKLKWW